MTRCILPAIVAVLAFGAVANEARAREPLPTIEVVQPKKRVRILDTRGPLQFGWGYSNLWKTPVYAIAFEAQWSFVEITKSTWLHMSFGENVLLAPYPVRGSDKAPGMLGVDLGVGLSRYATGGPGFFVGVTAGPRWLFGHDRAAPDGVGVVGRADLYPFYLSIPEIVKMERQWFRKYILSSVHLWVNARYDHTPVTHGNTYAGGIGLDVGRTLMAPIIERVVR